MRLPTPQARDYGEDYRLNKRPLRKERKTNTTDRKDRAYRISGISFQSKPSKVGKIDSNERSRVRSKVDESCNQTGGEELSRPHLHLWWGIDDLQRHWHFISLIGLSASHLLRVVLFGQYTAEAIRISPAPYRRDTERGSVRPPLKWS